MSGALESLDAAPPIATREEWLKARLELLEREKANTREYDAINAQRRRLPMVKVEKEYRFQTAEGERTLLQLFEGRRQLIVYHFMFGEDWEEGCPGCTSFINALGDLSDLAKKDVSFVLASRASLPKLEAYARLKGWNWKWVSSGGSTFNEDFGVTVGPETPSYNYKTGSELEAALGAMDRVREMPGTSVFFRVGDEVFHTYSTFARGGEALTDSYRLLDITPWGRQEDFEDSPSGWPQSPTYG